MATTTKIEWSVNADGSPGATWNPVRARRIDPGPHHGMTGTHCVHASEGCRNCYAERWNNRALPGAGTGLPYAKQSEAKLEIFLDEKMLAAPLKRRKPTTWFLSSMTDVFADFVPDAMLDRLFAVMALSPQHTFIVLTKRAKRMREYLSPMTTGWRWLRAMRAIQPPREGWGVGLTTTDGALPNVWLGVSAEDQKTADERIPDLLTTPAAMRLLSAEPLLGAIDLTKIRASETMEIDALRGWATIGAVDGIGGIAAEARRLDWVIVGGESGPGARPMHPLWPREIRDDCIDAGVPFFFKQWGEWNTRGHAFAERVIAEPYLKPESDSRVTFPWGGDDYAMFRIGKVRAGRQLDGAEHNARPPLSAAAEGEARLLATTASPGRPA